MHRSIAARLAGLTLAAAFAVACTSTPAASVAPSAPVLTVQQQIVATSTGLDEALAAYKAGDTAKADQLAGDAYLEHFEFVEGPLEAVDAEMTEELEELIRDELREAIKAKKAVAEIEALVNEAKTDLLAAAAKLQ